MARGQFWFFFPFRVRYSEIDGQRVVFNAHYLTYFDTAITEYLRELGFRDVADLQPAEDEFHAVRAVVEFKEPIYFDQEIEVGVRPGRIGNSSLTFALEIHPKGAERLLASGELVWVNTNQRSRKSSPLPDHLVRLLRARDKVDA